TIIFIYNSLKQYLCNHAPHIIPLLKKEMQKFINLIECYRTNSTLKNPLTLNTLANLMKKKEQRFEKKLQQGSLQQGSLQQGSLQQGLLQQGLLQEYSRNKNRELAIDESRIIENFFDTYFVTMITNDVIRVDTIYRD